MKKLARWKVLPGGGMVEKGEDFVAFITPKFGRKRRKAILTFYRDAPLSKVKSMIDQAFEDLKRMGIQ
jgi:hypothetical protein